MTTQGITGSGRDLAAVQDLDVTTGSLAGLGKDTVAIDDSLADSKKVKTGDRLELRLPDGTKAAPRVIATYSRGLGLSQVTLAQSTLATHTSLPFATDLFRPGRPRGGDRARAAGLGDRQGRLHHGGRPGP
ncbi:hypothetical protein [Streptomyces sp. A5-4]|uniref:hypothetical protein n=1 Tax=Streptomyces sp. A5-4 TaxID=3384771 RepID=UPI003DA8BDE3